MKYLITRLTLTAALSTVAMFGSDDHFSRIADAAQKTQAEARDLSAALKPKNADMKAIHGRMDTLQNHALELTQMVEAAQSSAASLTGPKKAEFERLATAAKIVSIFVENKKNMLGRDDAARNRSIIRANADGIAQRAAMVQKSALKLKS